MLGIRTADASSRPRPGQVERGRKRRRHGRDGDTDRLQVASGVAAGRPPAQSLFVACSVYGFLRTRGRSGRVRAVAKICGTSRAGRGGGGRGGSQIKLWCGAGAAKRASSGSEWSESNRPHRRLIPSTVFPGMLYCVWRSYSQASRSNYNARKMEKYFKTCEENLMHLTKTPENSEKFVKNSHYLLKLNSRS